MYSRWQLAIKYLKYYFSSSNGKGHGIHSPFIFEFITKVLRDNKTYDACNRVENLRKQLMNNSRSLVVEDFGAGSGLLKTNQRSIQSITRYTAKSKKYGQLMYRIAQFYQPQTILELGTSLGITTSYLALAQPGARVVTAEGSNEIAAAAQQNFQQTGINNIEIVKGNFDDTIGGILSNFDSIDLAFIDGNHRQIPTERYFNQILTKTQNDSILIFDDIHWSREMEQAWANIKEHPSVRCSIDLFFIGIILFRREFREKQDFRIRY
ncbi:MAG TPA: class I SAM-dependent methyltransferase [Chitinophagaceae bacterium]|nr:class I SAM-dependent methyltransferase [Chitinophagaceae bacterium]